MNTTTEAYLPEQFSKPRNAFVAFLLSLFTPGLGQIYNGQIQKGVIFFCLLLLFPFLCGLVNGANHFYGLMIFLAIEIGLRIYTISDAIINAKRQKLYVPKVYNTWFYHLALAVLIFVVLWFYNISAVIGVRSFKLPTTSNHPTLWVGDRIIADMKIYKTSKPDYGDIVVFDSPEGGLWMFRVIGLPNDKLEVNNNIVSINGKLSKTTFLRKSLDDGALFSEFMEELPNGHRHKIYKSEDFADSTKINIAPLTVPSDSYFLMGDNRDNAFDSRYFGCINQDAILGRVLYSYWGERINRVNVNFTDK